MHQITFGSSKLVGDPLCAEIELPFLQFSTNAGDASTHFLHRELPAEDWQEITWINVRLASYQAYHFANVIDLSKSS